MTCKNWSLNKSINLDYGESSLGGKIEKKKKRKIYFFFRYGNLVRLLTPVVYPSGISQGLPLFGLFPALQK